MHYEILDEPRKRLLPLLGQLKNEFYLAGGTALALYYGHRKSIDFDFFTEKKFHEQNFQTRLFDLFKNLTIKPIQLEWQTVECLVNGVKLSFFYLPYPLLDKVNSDTNLRLASPLDIACLKLNAIVSRSVNKDFVDLYYILQNIPLAELLDKAKQKMPALNENIVLKSLVYFEDLLIEPLEFLPGKEIDIETVKKFLVKEVKKYMDKR